MRALGKVVGQKTVAEAIGVTTEGADEDDILHAIWSFGYSVDIFEGDCKTQARAWLYRMAPMAPVILCVDRWSHWVTLTGVCGDRFVLIDPERSPRNARENGVWIATARGLLRRWKTIRADREHGGLFYGITILPTY